jgi:hypothetical protein
MITKAEGPHSQQARVIDPRCMNNNNITQKTKEAERMDAERLPTIIE